VDVIVATKKGFYKGSRRTKLSVTKYKACEISGLEQALGDIQSPKAIN